MEASDFGHENARCNGCNSLVTLEDDICGSHEMEVADMHTQKKNKEKKGEKKKKKKRKK